VNQVVLCWFIGGPDDDLKESKICSPEVVDYNKKCCVLTAIYMSYMVTSYLCRKSITVISFTNILVGTYQ